MKKLNLIFMIMLLLSAVSFATAQNENPPANDFVSDEVLDDDRPVRRGQIIARELDLTREQMVQIREINQQRRPLMQEAQQRFRTANEELDELIYSDTVDETTLQTKIRAVAEAQAEITKIRALSELAVRNVLTPEQLVKFRNLRERFQEQQQQRQMQRRQNRRQMNRRDQPQRPRSPQNRNRRN